MAREKILRDKLLDSKPTYFMEAHNALSAKIVECEGFEAIWASGLSISAAMGFPDRNEASWCDVVSTVQRMADHVDTPILMDGDTGFGSYNNVMRIVKELCRYEVAGVCLEDKLFPKKNSFVGEGQALADVNEFTGKIRAAKDAQTNNDFVVVARLEALVSGKPMSEAIDRAHHYSDAGADAILVHSKKSCGDEVIEFANCWGGDKPLIIVPTKYYTRPTSDFISAGIDNIIWANHNLRSSVYAMKATAKSIREACSVNKVEKSIASIEEIFQLTNEHLAQEQEKIYG